MYDRVLILPSRAMHAAVAPRLEEGQAAFYRAEGLVGQRTRELRFMGTEAYWKRQPEFAQIACAGRPSPQPCRKLLVPLAVLHLEGP